MQGQTFKILQLDDGVASLKIATDEQPYFEEWFIPALRDAVEKLTADKSVRSVIIEGGERYFSAGASREMLLSRDAQTTDWRTSPSIPRLILAIPVPTVAAMAGHALGGGLILGLWCDITILAEESLYGANFIALGITPGMGATAVLEEAVGASLARELLFTGRLVKGRELKVLGGPLAHAFVPYAEVRSRAISIAREIAEIPREALLLLKESLAGRRREIFARATKEEQEMHAALFAQEETRSGIAERYLKPIALAEDEKSEA
jgi:enoyl-CoA hydratase/carnithine racemase